MFENTVARAYRIDKLNKFQGLGNCVFFKEWIWKMGIDFP